MNDFVNNKLLPFFRLIRWANLMVILITMYLLRHAVLIPIYTNMGYVPAIDGLTFSLLVFSVILIAVAGYIINDYFDIRIDRLNKPDKVLLGRFFHRRKAILFHSVFNVLATLSGLYVAWKCGSLRLGLIFPMSAMLLWLYSVRYKRVVLWGNLAVALLSALVIGMVWLFEFLALRSQPETFVALQGSMALITKLFAAYALFAFMVSLIREVVKDAEDIQGDAQAGCLTFSVVHGTAAARMLALYLAIVTLFLLGAAIWWLFNSVFIAVAVYLIVTVALPLAFLLFRIHAAYSKSDFGQLSFLLKLLMLAGIFSMLPLAFLL